MSKICFSTILFTVLVNLTVIAQIASGQQKMIKDPAEYNSYIAALNTTDSTRKAAAMESFISQYPNSVVKVDAMEQAMAAYQQAGNAAKVGETAERILQLYPENVRALAIAAYLKRSKGDAKAAAEAGSLAEQGLKALAKWPKPDGISDTDFKKLSDQMAEIFDGAAAFALLQTKD